MEKISDDECSSCGGIRIKGRYRNTGLCKPCLINANQKGWKPLANGCLRRGDVTVMPSVVVSISNNQNERTQRLTAGDLDIRNLEIEELIFGGCKNEDGSFPLRKPELSSQVLNKIKSEIYRRADQILLESLFESVQTIREVIISPEVDAPTRLRAAIYSLERIMGKTPDTVAISESAPWETIIDKIARGKRPDKTA